MKIVITMDKVKEVREFMNQLYNQHYLLIDRYEKATNRITLINGDTIQGYSFNSRTDGVCADVAIGLGAEKFTWRSQVEYPIWDMKTLEYYLLGMYPY